jgi:hypothetical protein
MDGGMVDMKIAAVSIRLQIDAGGPTTRDAVREYADTELAKLNVDSNAVLYQMIQLDPDVQNGWLVDVLLPIGGE